MTKSSCEIGTLFSDLEGLRMAIEMEVRGREFYQEAYKLVEKKEHKELFLLLKDEEIHHEQRFTAIYDQLKSHKNADAAEYLFDQDTSRYLTVLVEGSVFPAKEFIPQKVAELKTVLAILGAALQAEKDSILFYDELARCARFEEAKQVFLLLKAEEQTHVVKLREMMDGWA